MRLYTLTGFLALQALLIGISIPLLRGRIARNPVYGFRTPATLANDEVWYPANRAASRIMIVVALLDAVAAIALYRVPIGDETYLWALFALLMASILFDVVISFVQLGRIIREGRRAATNGVHS